MRHVKTLKAFSAVSRQRLGTGWDVIAHRNDQFQMVLVSF